MPITDDETNNKTKEETKDKLKNKTTDETKEALLLRQKRDIIIRTALSRELNGEDDEKENLGIEEV